ncbi:methyl-accepting chemotaxis protein signaling domain protein [Bacteriovorax sp. BAL6_X]|uniref:methyl-accepting chemotaxis protein n=1 Tax=Bacteriovorax sp. BAL6_X TaxID=1201290 RepID=UPI00038683E5|nr:cache domain-containing protein [Bacteriovorax sp. BAL6_X]EPZ52415.1 methyl-accepting chemotaxis protein signaling domain protein [Bacteriovorax sp. BAL6_X]
MKALVKSLSLNTKIILMALIPFVIFTSIFITYSYNSTKSALLQEKKNQIEDVTKTAYHFLESMNKKVEAGEYSLKEAKEISKYYISNIRYGRDMDDYVWINDLEPRMIVHPSNSLRGKSVKTFVDKAGKPLFNDVVALVKKQDRGFVNYIWNSKTDSNKFVEKYSYVELYRPWGWVLGTGIYVDDVNDYIFSVFLNQAMFGFIGLLIIGALFTFVLKTSVSNPLLIMANQLKETSLQVANGSKVTYSTSTQLSAATNEQAASLQETVASVDEISSMIRRNTEFAEDSKKSGEQSELEVQNGKRTIDEMLYAIENISNSNTDAMKKMESSNAQIQEILNIIKEIEDKTKVINDIVFQTKLLSFNASVEAARSGESGKGFAVVAEEIGSLASMSGAASDEIKVLIDESIKNVEAIVSGTTAMVNEVIHSSSKTVEAGRQKAGQCKEVLDKIVFNVQNVNGKITEIASACNEQTQGVNEITNAIRLIDETTIQNNNSAQEASRSAANLKGQADNLDDIVKLVIDLVGGNKAA